MLNDKFCDIEKLSLYETPEESIGYLLWRASLKWRGAIEDVLKVLDLTHPQFVVLATTGWLTRNGDNVAQIAISKASGLDPNTLSQVLRSLETKKLIKRVRSINERSKSPVLTALGFEKLTKALPAVEQADKAFFATLSYPELDVLIGVFQRLVFEFGK